MAERQQVDASMHRHPLGQAQKIPGAEQAVVPRPTEEADVVTAEDMIDGRVVDPFQKVRASAAARIDSDYADAYFTHWYSSLVLLGTDDVLPGPSRGLLNPELFGADES
jgi:hypothetical protein